MLIYEITQFRTLAPSGFIIIEQEVLQTNKFYIKKAEQVTTLTLSVRGPSLYVRI